MTPRAHACSLLASLLILSGLAVLVAEWTLSTTARAALPEAVLFQDGPDAGKSLASTAGRCNKALRDLYLEIRSRTGGADASPGTAGVLQHQLLLLVNLEPEIRQLGDGPDDAFVRLLTLRSRAEAFVHGWATMSLLSAETSRRPDNSARRKDLLTLDRTGDSRSPLALLLNLYAHIRAGEASDQEPLRQRLKDGAGFFNELAYDFPWKKGEKPANVTHERYIPSASDLIGKPIDVTGPQRDMLSLWALVNLQLDTWHGKDLELGPLAEWLIALAEQPDLRAGFGSANPGLDLVGGFSVRTARMGKFVRFRSVTTDTAKLRDLIDRLYRARTEPGRTIAQVVPDLIDAATPIAESGGAPGDAKGWVRDAEIWLRYLILLSYRADRTLLLDLTAENSLRAVWKKLEPDIPLDRARNRAQDRPACGFLRWNRDPDECHSSAVLADLVQSLIGYHQFEARMASVEGARFRTVTSGSKADRLRLADDLDSALSALRSVDQDCLKRYRQGGVLEPIPAAFRDSTTASEEGRWYEDVVVVREHVEGVLERATLLSGLNRAPELSQSLPALERIGSLSGLANWNVNEMPRRTFRQYQKDLDEQIKLLETGAAIETTARRLRGDYTRSREQLRLAQLEQRAARLGSIVAEKAVRVSELFERVANIDTEIAELGVKIASLQNIANTKTVDAAGLRLTYATRLRDLVAARVDALVQASSDATEIARKAEDELQSLADRFDDIAKKIQGEKESSSLFGIIKAVVNVVGAVLAPFTGGASLVVAQLANKGLDIYQKIDKGKWSDPFAAVATVSEVAGDLQGAINFGIKELGGPGGSQALADVQTFLTSARDKIDQLKTLSTKGQQVLNAFKAAEKGDAARLVTALANGFPMTVDAGGGLKIDLGAKKIVFKNPELQAALKDLYTIGGHLVNDATSREWLKDLPALPDALLRGKLKEAFDRGVQALPPEVRAQVLKLPGTAEEKFQAELKRAKQRIIQAAEGNLSEEERRVLASALAGGMLFVQSGQVVVAYERPLDRELERLQERMKRVAERAYSDTIQKLLAQLEEKRNALSKRADDLAGKNDDAGLRQLAQETKQREIPSIKIIVAKVREELDKAREELEDKDVEAKIAGYESEAAQLRLEAAGFGLGSAEKQRERAALIVESAKLQGEIARTTEEQSVLKVQITGLAVAAAATELQRAYRESLLYGVNPESGEEATASKFLERVLSLRCVVTGELGPADEGKRFLVRRIASDLVGMVQWAEILRLSPKDGEPGPVSPTEAYLSVLEIISTNQPSYLKDADPKTHKVGRLHALSTDLDRLFSDHAGERSEVMIPPQPLDLNLDVRWVGLRSDKELDLLFPSLSQQLRRQVLGVFNLRFSTSRQFPSKASDVVESIPPGEADQFAYFVDVNTLYMAGRFRNLSFLPISPDTTIVQDAWAVGSDLSAEGAGNWRGPLLGQPTSFVRDTAVEDLRKSILRDLDLWKKLRLVGGLGEWTFLIMGNGVTSETVRRGVIDEPLGRDGPRRQAETRKQELPVDLGYPFLRVRIKQ